MIQPDKFIAGEEVIDESVTNLYNVIKSIQQELRKQQFNQLLTAIYRYTLPGWGFCFPTGNKMTQAEKSSADEFAKTIMLEQVKNALNIQQEVFNKFKITTSIQRNYRARLKKLIDFCEQHQWWSNQVSDNHLKSKQYRPLIQKGRNADIIRTTNKSSKPRFGLGCIPGDIISFVLKQQLGDFEDFLIDGLGQRKETAQRNVRRIFQILGSETYRQSVGSTEELNLHTMIPFVPLRTGIRGLPSGSSIGERLIRVEELKEEAEQVAIQFERFIKRLLRWYREVRQTSPGMEKEVVIIHIQVAKFLYQDETNKLQATDYEDIPVIMILRQLLKEAMNREKTASSVIDIEKKWLDWPEWLQCVETLRQEAICCIYTRKDREAKATAANQRVLRGIAQSLQVFLLASFWAFLPPDRQRTVRELEEGKSLVWKDSQWYIHLESGDTKINNDEEWIPIPNIKFADDTHLYQYLCAWLHDYQSVPNYANIAWTGGLRDVFARGHNYCFTMVCGKSLTGNATCNYIKRRVHKITGKVLTPHLIRSMYISYLEDNGTPEYIMQATAQSMHHSRNTQRRHYDKRQKSKKMQPGLDLAVEIAQSILHN